ncbi:hypothetical protein NIAMH_69 [Serratia phage vB_SmaS_Niamh]|nr:hypothetical protein NIAMH_69 [Serratia phage vB_SmaS_Niamh]
MGQVVEPKKIPQSKIERGMKRGTLSIERNYQEQERFRYYLIHLPLSTHF